MRSACQPVEATSAPKKLNTMRPTGVAVSSDSGKLTDSIPGRRSFARPERQKGGRQNSALTKRLTKINLTGLRTQLHSWLDKAFFKRSKALSSTTRWPFS